MPTYTILTTHGTLTVDGDHWARSDAGVYVYPDDDGSDPVAEVDGDEFIGIVADGGSATHCRRMNTTVTLPGTRTDNAPTYDTIVEPTFLDHSVTDADNTVTDTDTTTD